MGITSKAMQQYFVFILMRNEELSYGLNNVVKIKVMI